MRIAVVGCGRMGRERALAVSAFGVDELVLYDPDADRASLLSRDVPLSRVVRREEDLDVGACDALFVCTPPFARGAVEIRAIERGVPLFVEKPIGLSTDHCAAVRDALERTPVLTSVGYMNRYRRSVVGARTALAAVPVVGFCGNWICGEYQVPWWSNPALSGGPLNEQMTHLVDLTRFLIGEVLQVQATGGGDGNRFDSASVTFTMTNGSSGTLFYSCRAVSKSIEFRAFTPTDTLRLIDWDLRWPDDPPATDRQQIFRDEVNAFLSAVTAGSPDPILCSYDDAFRTQAVVDAIGRALIHGGKEPVPAHRCCSHLVSG
jgi:myo-inositol 2-dehydrogenase / D-chiro-inositol 1-dehydrogenase